MLGGRSDRFLDEGSLVGYVAIDGDIAGQLAIGISNGRNDGFLGEERPVFPPVDEFALPLAPGRDRCPHSLVERGRLEAALEEPRIAMENLGARVAGQSLEGRVDEGDPPGLIDHHDRVGGVIYDSSSGKEWDAKAWINNAGLLKVRGYWNFPIFGETMSFKRIQ